MVDDRISQLIAELEVHAEGTDEEAAASLIALGEPVIAPLIERVSTLDAGAQLGAIEVFLALRSTAAEPALVAMLEHDDDRVRDWAAGALGDLQLSGGVPHLRALLTRSKAAGTPPSWTEPTNARRALTLLGARTPVVPPGLQALLVERDGMGLAVRDEDLDQALDRLREGDQVVAYFQRWRPSVGSWYWQDGASWDLDWDAPWDVLVARSHEEARTAPRGQAHIDDLVTVEWLGTADWATL